MKSKLVFVFLIFISFNLYSNPIELSGTQSVTVKQSSKSNARRHSKMMMSSDGLVIDRTKKVDPKEVEKTVEILKYHLSAEAQKALKERLDKANIKPFKYDALSLPEFVQLAMDTVPVLDQGQHGSCVTFAVTAALDAAIQKGDYMSQLCHLTLGNYLHNHYGQPSGWDGSWGDVALDQIKQYGYMSIADQKQYHCGGLTLYPAFDPSERGVETSPEEFARHSLLLSDGVFWDRIFSIEEAMSEDFKPDDQLNEVRSALANGHRVVIGTMIDIDEGQAGASGQYKEKHDTWMLTPMIEQDLKEGAINNGHELIITGYDDNAVINNQKGVFTLRNSWGDTAGDKGNYYMTYDYFKMMVNEAFRIYSTNDRPQYQ